MNSSTRRKNSALRRLKIESLEQRRLLAGLPYGAIPQDTGEYMLGRVAVTPVFLESNGQFDVSTENWNPQQIQATLQKIQTGLDWWVDLLATKTTKHSLEFVMDTTYAVNPVGTKYEPINRVSNDFGLWTQEFLTTAGFNGTGSLEQDMRNFNIAQRQKLGTDWAFTIMVVNSNNDSIVDGDGTFAIGGAFSRAFGFAGGLFFVSPSTRPASTFAHETGHQFWAKDEYAGGASYNEFRGYYNTQNINAADNPSVGFIQQPSIMASAELLDNAYANHVSPASTLAMIGWQDSDGDGIFDVLDVPLELTGTGAYDSINGRYHFNGFAKVGVLANTNPEGLRNDISLNRVSEIQYRIDNGSWVTLSQPDAFEATLDLDFAVPGNAQTVEIRAIDAKTGLLSNVFQGRVNRADAVPTPGINGFVWLDNNKNGLRDPGEFGDTGWTIQVLSGNGQPLTLRTNIEPDNLPDGLLTANSVPGFTITALGNDSDGRVGVFPDSVNSTGAKNFRSYSTGAQSWLSSWTGNARRMKVQMASPVSVVEIDAIGALSQSYGRLEAYDTSGNLLDRFTTPKLSDGQVGKMRVESTAANIAYIIAGAHANSSIRLDNLKLGPQTSTTTTAFGQFVLPYIPAGNYQVKVTPPATGFGSVSSGGSQQNVTVSAPASTATGVDFAFQTTSIGGGWQNTATPLDVNNDLAVTALDVLLIVNEINQNGVRQLPQGGGGPPYVDTNGDSVVSALDALLIVNFINQGGAGEGEASQSITANAAGVSPMASGNYEGGGQDVVSELVDQAIAVWEWYEPGQRLRRSTAG